MLIVKGKTMGVYKNTPWHFGVPWANKTLDFLPSDSEKNFRELCKVPEFLEYFKSHGWLEPGAISYKMNNQGFRCAEFVPGEDCIVALGCSFTVGIGLPIETTWPELVGKELGLKVYNLAWGGNAADTCFRMAEYWVPQLRPKAVFMLTPPDSRVELLLDSKLQPAEIFFPSIEISHNRVGFDNYMKHYYANDENSRLNHKKNKLAVKALCDELDTPCQIYDVNDYMVGSRKEVGYARDRMHAGPGGHKLLAERILDDWRKKHT